MIPYEVIEAKEILHEGMAELLADVNRIKERMAIDLFLIFTFQIGRASCRERV